MIWFCLGLWLWAGMSVFGCTCEQVDNDKRWLYALICLIFWPLIGFYCATSGR